MTLPADTALLAEAVGHLNAGDLSSADACIRQVLRNDPSDPVALCLHGAICFEQGDLIAAEASLRQALAIDCEQPETLFHLARTLRAAGRPAESIGHCRAALAHGADPGMLCELAAAQADTGAMEDASASYLAAYRLAPGSFEAARGAAIALRRLGRSADAERLLRDALVRPLAPEDMGEQAETVLELADLLKTSGRHPEALALLDRLADIAPDHRQVWPLRAAVLQHLGRPEDAAASLKAALQADPLDLASHVELNELLYRRGRNEEFLTSYDVAARAVPSSPLPHAAKGHMLLKTERVDEAGEAYRRALSIAPNDAATLAGYGRALELKGEAAEARAIFEAGLTRHPSNLDLQIGAAGFLLRAGDVERAHTLAALAHTAMPSNQEALALLGLCHRASASELEHWLNGYDKLVRVFDLAAPRGFRDMINFNVALAEYLSGLHTDLREHFTQTLRGGTRLYGTIFNNGHELVNRLRERIDEAVSTYIAELPDDPVHPFVARRSATMRYVGSWSSRMLDRGFHINHIHPAGWISSAYYVAVPDVSADTIRREGWLTLGQPTSDFGIDLKPRRLVQPVPGRLVLFPSYLWHGTTPFRSPQSRMTIAFDVAP